MKCKYLEPFFNIGVLILLVVPAFFCVQRCVKYHTKQESKQTIEVKGNGNAKVTAVCGSACEFSFGKCFRDKENNEINFRLKVRFRKEDRTSITREEINDVDIYVSKALQNYILEHVGKPDNESLKPFVDSLSKQIKKDKHIIIDYILI
jgi:hypothetical protein